MISNLIIQKGKPWELKYLSRSMSEMNEDHILRAPPAGTWESASVTINSETHAIILFSFDSVAALYSVVGIGYNNDDANSVIFEQDFYFDVVSRSQVRNVSISASVISLEVYVPIDGSINFYYVVI